MKQASTVSNGSALGFVAKLGAVTFASSATAAGMLVYGVRGRGSQLFGPSVYEGCNTRRSIALTFDDGPSEGSLALLEYLEKVNVRATFFQCGLNILRKPAAARAIYSAGHEIGNHTYSHARLCPRLSRKANLLSPAEVFGEFSRAQDVIESELGISPALLRAPYGFRWFGMRQMQKRLNLLGVMWTVIGRDWELPAADIARLVLRKAAPGGIICLHDGRDIQRKPDISETVQAVKQLVPALIDQGYSFETVPELLKPTPTSE